MNFIDTADMYSAGESEVIVGEALRGRRDDVVLATKVHFPMGDGPNRRGNSRRWILKEVEESLKRLRTDWIDLYQVHRPDHTTDIEETLDVVEQLIELASDLGCSLPELAVAFPAAHPAVTSVIIGPRTMEQLEATLKGSALTLADRTLDRIDEIVPPGTDLYRADGADGHRPPAPPARRPGRGLNPQAREPASS
ncbi:aldo/keto reductase [Nonomuraea jabiensis]|uniref:Aryl-alcohol dehydrogenase-like predicted oxidoreductase n=1 Tax=Nonomuraea jabiensis TaxID=882448 RepID=A0A7W9GFL8_9ACTN|nr:aldo/keto reductase [Nonomuraea jabiensis]MBB5782942.1 aryl-alcohol dehydrogenase-like predicted oxidoreductase [Nonomuraea jabiensis]